MSDTIGRGVIEVTADSTQFSAAINDAKKSIRDLGQASEDASKRSSASIDRYVKSLQTQRDIQGKTTREAELYKLALRGASDQQLVAADNVLKLNEALERGELIGQRIRNTFNALAAVGLLAATGLIAAAVAFETLIKKAGDFQDLSEKAGDTAENLASLAVAAAVGGTSMDAVAGAANKLTKNLTGVDDESKAAGAAVKALGLNLGEFKKLSPADQLEQLGKALNGFADGPQKSAVAIALLGKAGAELLPFLKELGAEGSRQAILTEAQIKAADDYSDAQARAKAQLLLYAEAAATQALPAVTGLTTAFKELFVQLVGTTDQSGKFSVNNSISEWSNKAGESIAHFVDLLIGLERSLESIEGKTKSLFANLEFGFKALNNLQDLGELVRDGSGPLKKAFDDRNKVIKDAQDAASKELARDPDSTLKNFQNNRTAAINASSQSDPSELARRGRLPAAKPKLAFNGAAKDSKSDANQARKAQLDADLKVLKDLQGEERDAVSFHQAQLQALYRAGELSLSEFYAKRNAETKLSVQVELDLLTDEQARLEVELGKPAIKTADRIKLQSQLDESISKSSRVAIEAARSEKLANYEQTEAFKQLNEQISEYRTNLLQIEGNEQEANRRRANQQFTQAREFAKKSEGTSDAITPAELLRQETAILNQIQLNEASKKYGEINERLQITEERISLSTKTNTKSENDALAQQGVARRSAIGQLEEQLKIEEQIALTRPDDSGLALNVERTRLEIDKLKAALDPLAEKFDEVFNRAGTSAIGDFLNGTKSAKDALKDFGKSITTSINNDIAANASKAIFGKGGLISGGLDAMGAKSQDGGPSSIGSVISGIFTPKGDPAKVASEATATSLQKLTVSVGPLMSSLDQLQRGAIAAAAALSDVKPGMSTIPKGEIPLPTFGEGFGGDAPSGEKTISDLFEEPAKKSAALSQTFIDNGNATQQFGDVVKGVAPLLGNLGSAGGIAATALSILPSIISLITASSSVSAASSAAGSVGGFGSLLASFAHTGGLIGQLRDYRAVPASTFAGIARYHDGGLVQGGSVAGLSQNEVPAVLMGGPKGTREEVLHAADPRHTDNISPQLLKIIRDGSINVAIKQDREVGPDSHKQLKLLGARALGGPVSAGGVYEVNERKRPEILSMGGKQYLMPLANGDVSNTTTNSSSRPVTVTVNQSFGQNTSRATATQAANEAARALTRATARS